MKINRTQNYSIKEITPDRMEYILTLLSDYEIPKVNQVFIYGTGKQTRSIYEQFKKNNLGTEVIWYDFILNGPLSVLKYFIAGYCGLLRIYDSKMIKSTFQKLSQQSMSAIFIVDSAIENEFILETKKKYSDIFLLNDFIILNTSNYFIYIIDNDSIDSKTGIYEIMKIGEVSNLNNLFSGLNL